MHSACRAHSYLFSLVSRLDSLLYSCSTLVSIPCVTGRLFYSLRDWATDDDDDNDDDTTTTQQQHVHLLPQLRLDRRPRRLQRHQRPTRRRLERRKPQPMVQPGRQRLHHHLLRHGLRHGAGARLSVLGARPAKVGPEPDLRRAGVVFRCGVSVVLLGLLARLQPLGDEWLYWEFGQGWTAEDARRPESRLAAYS